jgi:SAM-dependent methyltransferase
VRRVIARLLQGLCYHPLHVFVVDRPRRTGAGLVREPSVDLVVAYNSLMDVDDMPGTVGEVARVLGPGGRFCACVTHPFADAGEFVGEGPDARFTVTRPYFGRHRFEGTFGRNGLTMTFRGWTYALEEYAVAFAHAGLLVELLREPSPETAGASTETGLRLPMFLFIRAVKLGPTGRIAGSEAKAVGHP